MDRVRVLLPALVGVALLGSFLLVPATNPPDDYAVSVERTQYGQNVTQYENLSPGYQQVFDTARESDGTVVYTGHTYPDSVEFPSSNGLSSRYVAYENTTYLVQFIHQITSPDIEGILRMLGSLAGGTILLTYAGYRRYVT